MRLRFFRVRCRFHKGRDNLSAEETRDLCKLLDQYRASILLKAYHLREEICVIFKSQLLAEAYVRRGMTLDRKEGFANTPTAKALALLGTSSTRW